MQFKRMVLVDKVERASMSEFTRLASTQLLTVQESGIGTKLWKKMGHVWTQAHSIYMVTDKAYINRVGPDSNRKSLSGFMT